MSHDPDPQPRRRHRSDPSDTAWARSAEFIAIHRAAEAVADSSSVEVSQSLARAGSTAHPPNAQDRAVFATPCAGPNGSPRPSPTSGWTRATPDPLSPTPPPRPVSPLRSCPGRNRPRAHRPADALDGRTPQRLDQALSPHHPATTTSPSTLTKDSSSSAKSPSTPTTRPQPVVRRPLADPSPSLPA
jgi:hypothetical protein